MKKVILSMLMGIFVLFLVNPLSAQMDQKDLEKQLKSKPPKTVKKEAKKLKKDGYHVAPGALPIEKQLHKAYLMQLQTDDKGYPKYIVSSGNSVGETQTAAQLQATETAKLDLAGKISTNVAALIENNIANQQLNNEDAASVTKTVAAAKNIIAQQLGRTIPIVELYKDLGKNVEVDVRLAYSYELAMESAKQVIRKSLEEETDLLQDQLEGLMNF